MRTPTTTWLFHLAFVGLFLMFLGIRGSSLRRAKRVRGEVSSIEGPGHRAPRLLVGAPLMLALGGYMLWPGLLPGPPSRCRPGRVGSGSPSAPPAWP